MGRLIARGFDIGPNTYIEHGIHFGRYVSGHVFHSDIRDIVTPSRYRLETLQQQTDKPVRTTGCYIHYARSLYPAAKLRRMKADLGKTLLVFPSHSIHAVHAEFDHTALIRFIENIKAQGGFDSVLVCLYCADIELGHAAVYEQQGYRVVTAGHYLDPCFLDRLKTLILLADYTVSNDLGSHIGYCIHLDKPHRVFRSEIAFRPGPDAQAAEAELNCRTPEQQRLRMEEKDHICGLFADSGEQITATQRECIDYYWGGRPDDAA